MSSVTMVNAYEIITGINSGLSPEKCLEGVSVRNEDDWTAFNAILRGAGQQATYLGRYDLAEQFGACCTIIADRARASFEAYLREICPELEQVTA